MTDPAAPPTDASLDAPRGPLAVVGALNVRFVVPLWIILGATVKMLEAAPSFLPMYSILRPARAVDLDLQYVLAVLVAIEFAAAFAMILIPRLARPLAIMILAVFCGVLVHEMTRGSSSCGCFGSKSPPPEAMLAIDAFLLLAAIFLRPAHERFLLGPARWATTAALAILMTVVTWVQVDPGGSVVSPSPPPPPAGDEQAAASDPVTPAADGEAADAAPDAPTPVAPALVAGPRRNPAPSPLPQFWFSEDLEATIGRPWTEFPLFAFMEIWPSVPDEGVRFVTFYSRTCDHCEDLFNDLLVQPRFARNTTAIEVPADKRRLRAPDGTWTLPPVPGLEMLALPVGPDWIITTPLDLRIEDGIVVAVTEGGKRPGEDEQAEPLPHGPVWDVDPAMLEVDDDSATSAAAGEQSGAPAPAPVPQATPAPAPTSADADADAGRSRTNPSPAELPQWWFSEDLPGWVSRDWREFDLFTFMPRWPAVPAEGTHYVVFYRRDCDHCQEMFADDLAGNEALARRTTAIEVPFDKSTMTPPGAWSVPVSKVDRMQMPLGPDYIITTPLAIRIEDGRITCIEEGDHATCLQTGG